MARYGRKAQDKVHRAMKERKAGTLRSGGSGKKVTSRKQAIAIGLAEARREGGKVPAPRKRRAAKKTGTARKRTASRKTTSRKTTSRKTAARKGVARKRTAAKRR